MRLSFVGLIALGITAFAACDRHDPLTAPAAPLAASLVGQEPLAAGQQVVDAFADSEAMLGADWYAARPAYVVDSGQVGVAAGQLGTTLAIWRTNVLPQDQFAEVTVGDLAGAEFAGFRGLQVFVRARSLAGDERVGFLYNAAMSRYEIKLEVTPGQVLAVAGPRPAPLPGDVLRLEVAGEVYTGRVNGREILRVQGPVLSGRLAGFAIGIDKESSDQNPRRVVDTWAAGGLPVPGPSLALTDLEPLTYRGFRGGLYPGASNRMPTRHDSVGRARARRVVPRDALGRPSATGKYVLLSIGMSNTTQEWCAEMPGPCNPWTFTGQAMADPAVNRTTLVIANGAMGGQVASTWDQPTDANYDRVRDQVLAPRGLSERQVQVIWIKVGDPYPLTPLPSTASDADLLTRELGNIVRAARARYPGLQLAFVSSRIYAGYATIPLNPEPFAFESGLAVKWLIGAQIAQMAGGLPDDRAGNLDYATVAPWVGWGPYLWANGLSPRADGLVWQRSDFAADGTHPSVQGQQKVGGLLLKFFKTDPRASCWFLAGSKC